MPILTRKVGETLMVGEESEGIAQSESGVKCNCYCR
jgi:sRNA-binding carbon storage regulator CsrA